MTIETARGIAARIWCDPEAQHLYMDSAAAEAIADIIRTVALEQGHTTDDSDA